MKKGSLIQKQYPNILDKGGKSNVFYDIGDNRKNITDDIKNIALLYSEDLKGIRLAPAYDLLSTVIYDSSTEKMSLNIDGEYDIRNINQKSFENEAKKLGLGKGIATQHFLSMVKKFEMALEQSTYELEEQGYGVAVDIQKQILKKAGIHNFKLTNP